MSNRPHLTVRYWRAAALVVVEAQTAARLFGMERILSQGAQSDHGPGANGDAKQGQHTWPPAPEQVLEACLSS